MDRLAYMVNAFTKAYNPVDGVLTSAPGDWPILRDEIKGLSKERDRLRTELARAREQRQVLVDALKCYVTESSPLYHSGRVARDALRAVGEE